MTTYHGETKYMLRSEAVPTYPEYITVHGLYKHAEEKNGKVYVWTENIVEPPGNRDWWGHNNTNFSLVPAGKKYKGFVVAPIWIGDWLQHLILISISEDD